ncbi:MAG: Uma2 family endonuclease [Chloroflexota bacterium]
MAIAPAVETRRLTVADLELFPDDGKLRELVDGQVVEWDVTNFEHGSLAAFLGGLLWSFTRERRLGQVVTTDALVKVQNSDYDARGGDVTYYRKSRIPSDRRAPATATPPDLVIEVLSPSDLATMVEAKVADWLRAGVPLLWYVNPQTGVTTVYAGKDIRRVLPEETLDGGEVLPGFVLRMADVLRELEEQGQGTE